MKCPHCNADMQTAAFGPHGMPLSFNVILGERLQFTPETWQVHCPHCKLSGPRQSSKAAAAEALRRVCGQSQEA